MEAQTEATSTRLFENNFLERLTHVHHNTPFFFFVPMIAASLWISLFALNLGAKAVAGGFLFGLLFWTFFEYMLHRFVFHYEPKTNFGKKAAYLFHGVHHDFPGEADRLVMPPAGSLPIAAAVFGLNYLLVGNWAFPLFAGFNIGYLYYEFIHYSVHHKKKPGPAWGEPQRRHHLRHHFKDHTRRFGVSSPLWDFVFGTYKE